MTNRKAPLPSGVVPVWRPLLALCLALSVWGCDDVNPRRPGAGVSLTPADEIAQLFDENEPFDFDFDLQDVEGNRLAKADFAGKVLIVDIWGTWCGPCTMEIPHFVKLKREYADRGLAIVGLNDEQIGNKAKAAEKVREFCRTEGVNYPCGLITERIKRQVPDFTGYPTTLFFDRQGRVRLKLPGACTEPYLRAAVEALLKETPPGETARPEESSEPARSNDEGKRDGDGERPVEK